MRGRSPSLLDLDLWLEVAETVRRNRLRTALTMFGVFWGMGMLVVMVGFGNGLETGVRGSLGTSATNAVWIWGSRSTLPYAGNQPGRRVRFTVDDVAAIESRVEGIEYLCPRNQLGGWRSDNVIRHGNQVGSFAVLGDVPEYRYVQPITLLGGRALNRLDLDERRKVALIGVQVRDELFGPGVDPVGQGIEIQGQWFQVIGLYSSPARGDRGDRQESEIHIPFTTFQQVFSPDGRIGWLALTARPDVGAAEVERQVRAVLAERHGLHPDDRPAIGSYNAEEDFLKVRNTFIGVRAFVWLVGTATLLTGVFGISNILLVSIRERTPELGIRRALGASPASIVRQVLVEAFVLTSTSGLLGLVVGVAIIEVSAVLIGDDTDMMGRPFIEPGVALLAAAVLLCGGLIAGIVPAFRAARLRPVEALRAE
ncbi:MAG: ABC transporter permease [Deltaproteobacteria bacterium]|nr:MAG: ABC transporter permease [Deltaproteobacteria bacterium]